jgi:arylsulfatase A-like enzyme
MFGSDHGDEFGEHGGLSHDGKMYSELIWVPLFIYDAARPAGAVFLEPVSNIDIAPTIAHLFGIEPHGVEGFGGESLLPLEAYRVRDCFGEAMNKRGHREKDEDRPVHFILRDQYKLIHDDGAGSYELYDLGADPEERKDLAGESDRTGPMKEALQQRFKSR